MAEKNVNRQTDKHFRIYISRDTAIIIAGLPYLKKRIFSCIIAIIIDGLPYLKQNIFPNNRYYHCCFTLPVLKKKS